MQAVGGLGTNIFLAGFSQGSQLTGYMQLEKLEFALGGAIVMSGYPLPPLFHWPNESPATARRNASYSGQDMRWMIWVGAQVSGPTSLPLVNIIMCMHQIRVGEQRKGG